MGWVFDTHPADSRVVGPVKVAGCVVARYGTGGGNTPMVVDVLCRASTQGGAESLMNTATTLTTDHDRTIIAHKTEAVALQGNIIDRDAGMNGTGVGEDVSFTLNTVDRHGVAYTFGKTSRPHFKGDATTYKQLDTANTLNTFDAGESRANEMAVQGTPPRYIVRRLMPMECGRLQGFPDGWGEIEQLTADMPEETAVFWRKVYETDCAIKGKKPQKAILTNTAKLAAWHNGLHTDSAEYKMWGNGMALPNALFFAQRAVARVAIDTGKGAANVKLGSMFDGSGTMPLCAAMCGAQPVWASEVEPYPIAVTKTHLPGMKHLGSVTDICGGNIEPVDIITFGSPCQDLSIAGKRAGLDGNRSGLFREAIRIILEMLEATGWKYPRFVIWENVPYVQKCIRYIIRSGCEGGGKGPLVQNDLSATLATHQDQTVFAPKVCGFIYKQGAKAGNIGAGEVAPTMKTDQPPAAAYANGAETVERTLTARADGSPMLDRGPNVILQKGSADEQ